MEGTSLIQMSAELASSGGSEQQSVPNLSPNSYDICQSSVFLALQTQHSDLCLHLQLALSLVYSVSRLLLSHKDTSHWVMAWPSPVWPHLKLTTSAKVLFPKRSNSQVLVVRILIYLVGGEGIILATLWLPQIHKSFPCAKYIHSIPIFLVSTLKSKIWPKPER